MSRLSRIWIVVAPEGHATPDQMIVELAPDKVNHIGLGDPDRKKAAFFDDRDEAIEEAGRRLDAYREYQRVFSSDSESRP